MDDRRLKELLRDAPLPDEAGARERGWRVIRAAFVERERLPRRGRRPSRLVLAVAGAAVVLAIALTPAGAKVADVFRDVTGIGAHHAEPALKSLPAPGRLLVGSGQGPWIVQPDGSKRLLGDYGDATWSAHGLHEAAVDRRQLVALDPNGVVDWTLTRPHPNRPAWSPSGFRIAYRSGDELRLVVGDGSDDRLLAAHTAPVTPAWRPLARLGRLAVEKGAEPPERLAFVDRAGRIRVVDTTGGREVSESAPGPAPRQLLWTADRRHLAAIYPREVRTYGADGRLERMISLPSETRIVAAAAGPSDRTLALATVASGPRGGTRGQVELLDLDARAQPRRVFSGPGRFTGLAFSPNGQWLLVVWRDADQWLFVPLGGGKVKAVGHISQQFAPGATGTAPFPTLDGWCCAR